MSSDSPTNNPQFSTIEAVFASQVQLKHELRSSLNAIIGYSEMLWQDTQDSGQNELHLGFKRLHKAGQRLLNTTNTVLEASRLATGTLELSLDSLVAKLRHHLRTPIDEFIAVCEQLLKRSEELGREGNVTDLRKIRVEGDKLIALLDGQGQGTKPNASLAGLANPNAGFRDAATAIRQSKTESEAAKAERGTILVVDDSDSNRDILSRQLHREGHTVFAATNGNMALQMMKSRKFDLVLLGIMLPEVNGYQVLEKIKATSGWNAIPVIMISALDDLNTVVKCLEMGAEDYLAKPFNSVVLKARIGACLEKKRLRDQERAYVEQLRIDQEKQDELLKDLASANWELVQTNEQLKATQSQLIIQEKLASLGALTAGIAHEIKNPLNFVNNFAALSMELADELKEELSRHRQKLEADDLGYIEELLGDLKQNAGKIHEHGNRADSIVRSMLLHSRGQSGEWQPTDLNALLAEYISLAYHGMRAQDVSFNLAVETDYDPSIGLINAVPQDLSRVFLNLLNNACYAVHQKKIAAGDSFSPNLSVRTRRLIGDAGERAEIRIRDNGQGIPPDALEKIFNPFFTTKPPGQGTGLGLSISYEIVVQQHKGEIKVETEAGEFTEFIIVLPCETA